MLGLSDDFQWVDLISINHGHMYRFIYKLLIINIKLLSHCMVK